MAQIKILPEILSNKIAAGEVVERPASVVKELLENSIDALSTRIVIEIDQGGKSLIRISDNGIGMKSDDALLAIERYATSKIHDDKDLFSINTLGFRGEALPSIASVSKFTLITKDEHSDTGTKIFIKGGVIRNVEETGAATGTVMEVAGLFFNTPARRKFMKTVTTEMGHIGDVVAQTALGWPNIQFRLTHNGKVVKNWSKTGNQFDRAVDIIGSDLKSDLHSISFKDNYFSFNGFISSPQVFRSTSRKIFIFVNGRFIKDRGISHAIFEGYKGRLVKGRFPVAVLYIDIDYDQVDVNVHPAKNEVRFSDQKRVYNNIKDVVSESLESIEKKKWSNRNNDVAVTHPKILNREIKDETKSLRNNDYIEKREIDTESSFMKVQEAEDLWSHNTEAKETKPRVIEPKEPDYQEQEFIETESSADVEDHIDESIEVSETLFAETFFSELRVCGQLSNTYILCESKNDLILIDQHAAHERIVFEEIKEIVSHNKNEIQILLMPETVDLTFKEATELEAIIPELTKTGFVIEPFGGNTFIIKAVPSILSDCDVAKIISEIAEKAVTNDYSKRPDELLDESLILMACHGAIRARQKLDIKEMENILVRLDHCKNSSHCPHGRPTWIKYSVSEIEKNFSRII